MTVRNYHKEQKKHQLDPKKIRHLMIDLELTNAEIARRLKTTEATVSRHISGARRNPSLQRRLAQVLGVKVEEIYP